MTPLAAQRGHPRGSLPKHRSLLPTWLQTAPAAQPPTPGRRFGILAATTHRDHGAFPRFHLTNPQAGFMGRSLDEAGAALASQHPAGFSSPSAYPVQFRSILQLHLQ